MDYRIKLTAPPASEPVTLDETKTADRILTNDFDSIIPGLIKAGREAAEDFQNTCYMSQTWKIFFDEFPILPLKIPKRPLASIDSIEYIDADGIKTSMDLNDFIIGTESNRIGFKKDKRWPSVTLQSFDSVIFTFKAGVEDISLVPESIKLAIELFVAENIDKPDNPQIPKGFYDLLWPQREVPV